MIMLVACYYSSNISIYKEVLRAFLLHLIIQLNLLFIYE
jgi:hypothetical protein